MTGLNLPHRWTVFGAIQYQNANIILDWNTKKRRALCKRRGASPRVLQSGWQAGSTLGYQRTETAYRRRRTLSVRSMTDDVARTVASDLGRPEATQEANEEYR